MKNLTLRGFDKDLERKLREVARDENLSLNKAALKLLRLGAGLGGDKKRDEPNRVGNSLDHLIGSWTKEEEDAFLESIRGLEQIDESFWS